jgi:hypothetical protein
MGFGTKMDGKMKIIHSFKNQNCLVRGLFEKQTKRENISPFIQNLGAHCILNIIN